jgi:hypothetical protein
MPTKTILLTRLQAADALAMSLDHFERHVQPNVKVVRSGRLRLVPLTEIERWAEAVAERV